MKGLKGWGLYGVMLALGAAGAIAAQQGGEASSPLPSVRNPGALGAQVLFVYLQERGYAVKALDGPLTSSLSPGEGLQTVVMAAPAGRSISVEETQALQDFVKAGRRLVYLVPRAGEQQKGLGDWLEVEAPPAGKLEGSLSDLYGKAHAVLVPRGAAAGMAAVQLSSDPTLEVRSAEAVPVAKDGALWMRRVGKGEVWMSAGPDLIENRRLERADNLRFWENLAADGPIGFDEFHHAPPPAPALRGGLWAVALQLLACVLAFMLAKGTRLGAARPEHKERHRSTLEYLSSFAALTRKAGVESELLAELVTSQRVLLQERLGIATTLSDAEAALEIGRRSTVSGQRWLAVIDEVRTAGASSTAYARLSRELAQMERQLRGLQG